MTPDEATVSASTRGGCAEWLVVDRLSSELLGYGPDARVLIVNCDDFGMHEAVNAAIVESIENGQNGDSLRLR